MWMEQINIMIDRIKRRQNMVTCMDGTNGNFTYAICLIWMKQFTYKQHYDKHVIYGLRFKLQVMSFDLSF